MITDTRWVIQDWWLEVEHTGDVTWDELQEVKNRMFGEMATCYEVYPPKSQVVNNANCRHLFRFGSIHEMLGK